ELAFLRTGDLGFVRGGELFVTGRRKDLLIIRGRNCYPQDLGATAEASHPLLRGQGYWAALSVAEGDEERLVVWRAVSTGPRRGVRRGRPDHGRGPPAGRRGPRGQGPRRGRAEPRIGAQDVERQEPAQRDARCAAARRARGAAAIEGTAERAAGRGRRGAG